MGNHEFLRGTLGILAAMALVSIAESVLPLAASMGRRRAHLLPNLALVTTTLGLNFALHASSMLLLAGLAEKGPGLWAGQASGSWTMLVATFVVLDASTYACHRSMHAWGPLWRIHRVHHCDPLVDVTTSLRQHPLESVWRYVFLAVPTLLLGLAPAAVAAYRVVSALVGLTEHMNVRVGARIDAALRTALCTPNMHKVHHSRIVVETDSNYGNIFSMFDRIFATFRAPVAGRGIAYGLDGFDGLDTQSLAGLLSMPFRDQGASAARLLSRPEPDSVAV